VSAATYFGEDWTLGIRVGGHELLEQLGNRNGPELRIVFSGQVVSKKRLEVVQIEGPSNGIVAHLRGVAVSGVATGEMANKSLS
jgi:hypothetical protein